MRLADLTAARSRAYQFQFPASRRAAQLRNIKTAFLCHSHKDADYAKGVQVLLAEQGLLVYIDWEDPHMPATPDRRTAERIQQRITDSDLFLFLATPNSTASRWCPWEIGYADGVKRIESIVVIPTSDSSGRFYGNEYLQLYRSIQRTQGGSAAVFAAGSTQGGQSLQRL
ncbi:MAG: toll/interleukin-1 receptor domain-containing protein [Planctomycetota bacterium]|jgi:hypothetical protein